LDLLEAGGVPAGRILDISEMHQDPQARARGMIVEQFHPAAGRVNSIGTPVKFSETPTSIDRCAPVLGQDTRAVLLEAGYSESEIDLLIKDGHASASSVDSKLD
jgi:crotonobetainyl-CoA:carnitine CoA-transferase CaiB-like acyl-CoA transferase